MNDSFLLKSSKRPLNDSQFYKDMPSLEFNGFHRNIHGFSVFQPSEMKWSTHDFN
jgi:hypothetical protein